MNFIKNNWFILLILILVIYLGYRYYMKIKAEKNAVDVSNLLKATNTGVKSESVTIAKVSNPIQPVNTPITSGYKIGDKIYAGSTGVNVHDTPSISTASLIKFYGKDQYIGTFVGFQSVPTVANDQFVKIIVSEPYNSFLDAFGFQSNAVRFALSKQVYSK